MMRTIVLKDMAGRRMLIDDECVEDMAGRYKMNILYYHLILGMTTIFFINSQNCLKFFFSRRERF